MQQDRPQHCGPGEPCEIEGVRIPGRECPGWYLAAMLMLWRAPEVSGWEVVRFQIFGENPEVRRSPAYTGVKGKFRTP